MKKISILFFAVVFSFATIYAQDGESNGGTSAGKYSFISKNGHEVLPATGDIALGFNAVPVLDFMLNSINLMNNTGQTAQHPGYVTGFNQVLFAKFYGTQEKALRFKLAINTTSNNTETFYDNPIDVANGITDPEEISDVVKTKTKDILLGVGMEFRRGHGRLQGFYGGEALLGFNTNSVKNEYGWEYGTDASNAGLIINGSSRVLSNKGGLGLGIGLRGFVGVEYFFAPKISVGAEFGWGFGFVTNPRGTVETETWNNSAVEVEENEGAAKTRDFDFQVDDGIQQTFAGSAALTLMFHF